jgi:hypothetical protein
LNPQGSGETNLRNLDHYYVTLKVFCIIEESKSVYIFHLGAKIIKPQIRRKSYNGNRFRWIYYLRNLVVELAEVSGKLRDRLTVYLLKGIYLHEIVLVIFYESIFIQSFFMEIHPMKCYHYTINKSMCAGLIGLNMVPISPEWISGVVGPFLWIRPH